MRSVACAGSLSGFLVSVDVSDAAKHAPKPALSFWELRPRVKPAYFTRVALACETVHDETFCLP